jgi:hypothetical protein
MLISQFFSNPKPLHLTILTTLEEEKSNETLHEVIFSIHITFLLCQYALWNFVLTISVLVLSSDSFRWVICHGMKMKKILN